MLNCNYTPFSYNIFYTSNIFAATTKSDLKIAEKQEGDFDHKIFHEKKLELVNVHKTSLSRNATWTFALNEYLNNKEPFTNLIEVESGINNITLEYITQLAKKNL